MFNVAVLGGGLAGLEAAISLARKVKPEGRHGLSVEVIECGPAVRRHHVDWDTATYPGDSKTRRWTSEGWGSGGGLAERLGGRSLCYHGVLLPIEPAALASWPAELAAALTGPNGRYERIVQHLAPDYPQVRPQHPPGAPLSRLGFQRVPQAARVCPQTGRFEAYSPLAAAHLLAADSRIRLSQGTVRRLRAGHHGQWTVDITSPHGQPATAGPFEACVLACSAIENVRILAATLDRAITTKITDHFAVGVLLRLPPGPPIEAFRHGKLWAGYLRMPELATNIFVHEAAGLPDGDRMLDICAVAEQGTTPDDYSTLTVEQRAGKPASVHVTGRITNADRRRLNRISGLVADLANQLSGSALYDLTPHNDSELAYNTALDQISRATAGCCARYQFPYGAFEHESCTHPLGAEGPVAVTTDCEVQELPAVYVIGPGSFPRLGAANPALTTIALSQASAESIHARY